MTDLDDRIRAALREEDRELFEQLADEPSVREIIRDGFSGQWGRWMIIANIFHAVIFGLGVWSTVRFVNAETVDDRVFWGTWLLLAGLGVVQIKVMTWMRMQNAQIHREMKRLELQALKLAKNFVEAK